MRAEEEREQDDNEGGSGGGQQVHVTAAGRDVNVVVTVNPVLASTLLDLDLDLDAGKGREKDLNETDGGGRDANAAEAGTGPAGLSMVGLDPNRDVYGNVVWRGLRTAARVVGVGCAGNGGGGVGHGYGGAAEGRVQGVGEEKVNTLIQTLSARLLTATLLDTTAESGSAITTTTTMTATARMTKTSTVYIVAPATTTIVPEIHVLLAERTSSMDAIHLLDAVQLLQYFDLTGLAESVAEVTQRAYQAAPRTRGVGHEDDADADGVAAAAEKGRTSITSSGTDILLIQGLSATMAVAQRRSGVVQATALMTAILRNITHVARTERMLVLVEVDVEVKHRGNVGDSASSDAGRGGEDIVSAFSSAEGSAMKIVPGGVMGRTLEAGLDMFVVVHDAFGKVKKGTRIVEMVKDRLGGGTGLWTVWAGP